MTRWAALEPDRGIVEAELRRPLFWKLNGACRLFFDCGQGCDATGVYDLPGRRSPAVWLWSGSGNEFSTSISDFLLRSLWQLATNSWQFYFSVGQYF